MKSRISGIRFDYFYKPNNSSGLCVFLVRQVKSLRRLARRLHSYFRVRRSMRRVAERPLATDASDEVRVRNRNKPPAGGQCGDLLAGVNRARPTRVGRLCVTGWARVRGWPTPLFLCALRSGEPVEIAYSCLRPRRERGRGSHKRGNGLRKPRHPPRDRFSDIRRSIQTARRSMDVYLYRSKPTTRAPGRTLRRYRAEVVFRLIGSGHPLICISAVGRLLTFISKPGIV